ncbi:MAG: Re/Si-specific NAD(P)(+) transhydrogenase subunit alpha [Caldithrix sp.]|nr:MAG: Re/Si-specific NAD(P)(+) transhydrogenase subunit alpha [Caldithrix sp.]
MKIGIPKEIQDGEARVAVVPSMIPLLTQDEHEVFVETEAGSRASFADPQYEKAGAAILKTAKELYAKSDVVLKFQAPEKNQTLGKHEIDLLNEGKILIGSLPPGTHSDLVPKLLERKISCFAMEYLPRITRAQSMDILSSMSTVAGYKAVLIAAFHLGKFFPLLMTAAGTVPPATVLVLGAGVAGLQAIATAKRLGAKVEAFDPRPAVREQVASLGVFFIDMEHPEDAETESGYAREQSDEFLEREREAITARLTKVDAIITTAQVFGKESPVLITEEMVKMLRPGSVIVDLAAAEGGNCSLSEANKTIKKHGVTIVGAVNLARSVPVHASQMHSKNIINLFKHLVSSGNGQFDLEDEITRATCITHNGQVINEMVKKNFGKEN